MIEFSDNEQTAKMGQSKKGKKQLTIVIKLGESSLAG